MLARGSLGNPWLFAQLLGAARRRADAATRSSPSSTGSMDRAVEHLGAPSAPARYLRKFYPWYVEPPRRRASAMPQAAPADARRSTRRGPSDRRLRSLPSGGVAWRYTARARIAALTAATPAPSGAFLSARPSDRDEPPCPRTSSSPPKASRSSRTSSRSCRPTSRREVAERIKEAREFGDISENSEYDDAKNEQAMLEQRIAQLEESLRSAQVDRRQGHLDRRRPGRLRRPRQGREDRQVAEVHDRRLGRGQPAGEQALQRVAGRQGADRPQAQRDRLGAGPARPGAQAQDHEDRRRPVGSRAMAADELLATRRAKLERLRADGVDPFPHAYPGVVPIAAVRARTTSLRRRRGDRRRATASPAASPRAAARARWRSSTSSTAPGASSCRRAPTCSARSAWRSSSSSTSATSSASTASRSARAAAS